MKVLLYGFLSILFLSKLQAQVKCGFDIKLDELRRENPGFEDEINKQVKDFILKQKNEQGRLYNVQAPIFYIPVVVHVINTGGPVGSIYNPSDANITGAINYLNAVYDGTWTGTGGSILGAGDIQIKFVLATKDPNNNSSNGINRVDGTSVANYAASGVLLSTVGADELTVKDLSRWDPSRYYNVWIVSKIDGLDGTTGSFVAGYANFPLANNVTSTSLRKDGIVMLATQMSPGAKTLPHEIGHAFNLYHPFQGETNVNGSLNTCPTNATPSTDGDACADTDPVINPADDGYGASAFNCRTGTNSCAGTLYSDNTEKNFMNYTNCYRLFTGDQKNRMLAAAANSTRSGLTSSWATNQGTYPTTWTAPVAATITPTCVLNNPNALGIMSVSMGGLKKYSLNATQDGGYVNNVKWYNLFTLQPNTAYSMTVGLNNSGNSEQVGVWIDYDGNGSFNDGTERVFYVSNNPASSQVAVTFTTPATLSGNIVRMRIINDFSTIYGIAALSGSSTSVYAGQVEDYPAFLNNGITLPLVLTELNGHTNKRTNYINWKTTQEKELKEFELQRSFNGSDYVAVGTIKSKGGRGQSYDVVDNNGSSGTYVYRLKMIGLNNSFEYSKAINLKVEALVTTVVAGNPFTDKIKLIVPEDAGLITIKLNDAAGRLLLQKTINAGQSNVVEIAVDPSLGKGIYILQTTINNKSSIHKLIKE